MINLLSYFRCGLTWSLPLLMLSYSVTAHQSNDSKPDTPSLPWTQSLSENDFSLSATPGKARVIVFRPGNNEEKFKNLPINIFVNGRYHASLLPENRAAVLNLCPGTNKLSVILGQRGQQPVLPQDVALTSLKMKPDTVLLYKVSANDQGKASGEWVSDEKYGKVVSQLPRQTHTLSRLAQNGVCEAEIFSINGSALFDFNVSDVTGLRPEGRRAIEEVIIAINRSYESVERIIVKGYTDPLGLPEYNRKLSKLRAKTVADIFRQAYIGSAEISYVGMGAENPLIKDCSARYENIDIIKACNQPNRRVEINVFGTKKPPQPDKSAKK